MDRTPLLPGGCKSLSDTVRVIGLDGAQLPLMTLAEAQTMAADHHAKLVHIATGRGQRIFRLVDDAVRSKLRAP
jgi:translation initiation factor IF-3